ncbi:MAG: hypothetical protein BGO52_02420 [Sphingobacteriales bacterium 44-61]|nr:MAG: hypothetical protein BGO52_02420 [Sphingobacteriales bacterium 44-61]
MFDEQFNYVDNGNSGAEPVEASGVVKPFNKTDMPVDRNGYLYIYTSNETSYDVFFDNLQVTHIRGPLLEETHYYPFGLTMAGISSKALEFGGVENKYKFNSGTELSSKEFSDGSGLDWYESFFRGYNPQIGRFHQIDPLGEIAENWTPYAFCNNNPLRYTDPLGLFSVDPEGPKETSTAEKPKELGGVTVVGFKNHPAPPPSGLNTGSPAASGVDARVTPLPVVNPSPTPAPNPVTTPTTTPSPSPGGGVAPVLGRIGGTILAVVTPTYGGLASGDLNPYQMPKPLVNPLPNPNPWTGHGNSRRNTNPHIVYEYSFIPTDDETPILKYGISDEYRYGMGRPQSQLAGLRALYGPTVTLRIITRTLNRDQALKIEQKLVDVHQINYRQMPREQYRPLPTAR